jgi:hypothetical protein
MKVCTIDSPYIKNILEELGFEGYPSTMLGISAWLKYVHNVVVAAYPVRNFFMWFGFDGKNKVDISEDFTEYSTLEEALEAGLVESICYLSLKNKPKKYYGDDDSRPE